MSSVKEIIAQSLVQAGVRASTISVDGELLSRSLIHLNHLLAEWRETYNNVPASDVTLDTEDSFPASVIPKLIKVLGIEFASIHNIPPAEWLERERYSAPSALKAALGRKNPRIPTFERLRRGYLYRTQSDS